MLVNFRALLWLAGNWRNRSGPERCIYLQLWRMICLRVSSPQSTSSWVKQKILVISNFSFHSARDVRCLCRNRAAEIYGSPGEEATCTAVTSCISEVNHSFSLCCWVTLLWEKTETAMNSMNSWNHKSHWDYSQLLLKETDSTTNIVFH